MRVIEPVRRGLWGHPDFLRRWAAQAISTFGSRITRTALPIIAVVTLGEPESIVGALVALQLAPGVLLSVVSGGFVDRGIRTFRSRNWKSKWVSRASILTSPRGI